MIMMVTIPVQLTMRPTYDMHEYTGSHKQQIIFMMVLSLNELNCK